MRGYSEWEIGENERIKIRTTASKGKNEWEGKSFDELDILVKPWFASDRKIVPEDMGFDVLILASDLDYCEFQQSILRRYLSMEEMQYSRIDEFSTYNGRIVLHSYNE